MKLGKEEIRKKKLTIYKVDLELSAFGHAYVLASDKTEAEELARKYGWQELEDNLVATANGSEPIYSKGEISNYDALEYPHNEDGINMTIEDLLDYDLVAKPQHVIMKEREEAGQINWLKGQASVAE